MRTILTLAVLAALSTPAQAAGGTPASILRDWGLLGAWSRACGDTSGRNSLTTYAARPDGKVTLTYSWGADTVPNVYIVNSVRIISPAIVILNEQFASDSSPYEVTLTRDGNRIRVLHSRDPDTGKAFVAAGVVTSNQRETNWEMRC